MEKKQDRPENVVELQQKRAPKHYGMVLEPGKFVVRLEPLAEPKPDPKIPTSRYV